MALAAAALPTVAAQDASACVEDASVATDHEAGRVTLTWSAVAGASFYDLHRSVDSGAFVHVATTTDTSFLEFPPEGVVAYRIGVDGHPDEACPEFTTHLGGGFEPTPDPVCVENVVAVANADRSITLSWDPVEDATVYHVHRVVGIAVGPLIGLVEPPTTSVVDEDLEVGVTYRYAVAAEWHPIGCPVVEATAIPFFPHAVAVALAAAAAVGVMVLARRR